MQVNEIVQEALLLPADAQLAIADLLYKNLGAADPEVETPGETPAEAEVEKTDNGN